MKLLKALGLMIIAVANMHGQENSIFKAKVELLKRDPNPGGESIVLMVVTNNGDKRVFIDHFDLTTMYIIEFSDRTGYIGPSRGRVINSSSHGAPLPISRIHETTLGLEPGQSFVRIIKIRNPQRSDWASVDVSAYIPATTDLSKRGEDWPDIKVSATLQFPPVHSGKQ